MNQYTLSEIINGIEKKITKHNKLNVIMKTCVGKQILTRTLFMIS